MVIVVIGILATVTIVAYNGIQKRATLASLQSDLKGASTQLKMYQVDNGAYPTSNDCSTGPTPLPPKICLKSSPGNSYTYTLDNAAIPQTFSLTATNTNGSAYMVTHDSAPSVAGVAAPGSQTFGYSATVQTFTIPAGISSVTLECWGAKADPENYNGGYAKGNLVVSGGDILNVHWFYDVGAEAEDVWITRPSGPMLIEATGGANAASLGAGYTPGVTNATATTGTNSGIGKVLITYPAGS